MIPIMVSSRFSILKNINDLPDYLTHKFKLNVDDGKLLVELGTDFDIDKIIEWFKTWSIELIRKNAKSSIWVNNPVRRIISSLK